LVSRTLLGAQRSLTIAVDACRPCVTLSAGRKSRDNNVVLRDAGWKTGLEAAVCRPAARPSSFVTFESTAIGLNVFFNYARRAKIQRVSSIVTSAGKNLKNLARSTRAPGSRHCGFPETFGGRAWRWPKIKLLSRLPGSPKDNAAKSSLGFERRTQSGTARRVRKI